MSASELRVLLIERDPCDARAISEWLAVAKSVRITVDYVDHLSRGVEYLKTTQVDVILVDLEAPSSMSQESARDSSSRRPDNHRPTR